MASRAEIEALGVAKEVAANKRRKDANLVGSASDYEYASNLRSVAAGFTSAADQEIDANKRARAKGWLNAADFENPGPGGPIRSTADFVDPRSAVKLPDKWYYESENDTTASKTAAPKTAASYVDLSPDLASAWAEIQSDPTGKQGSYWLPRMGDKSTKEAFGKAHAAEDMSLKLGTYNQGDTDYKLGSDPWKELFTSKAGQFGTSLNYPGDQSTAEAPQTRWEMFDPQVPPITTTDTTTTTDTADTTTTTTTDATSSVYVAPEVEIMDLATLTDQMDLTNKLEEVINMDSPLFKAAATKALQVMQKRGIVNSSLANEAVMKAVLDVALPIAQAEVEALQQNLYYNTNWTNEQKANANKYFYERMLVKMRSTLDIQLQKMVQSFGAWGRYGDWIQNIVTSQSADQDAWKRMLDAMGGAGGWPEYPG